MQVDILPETLRPRISELIAAKTGLSFPPERQLDLQRGLSDAAVEFGFANTAACAEWLLAANLTGPQLATLATHLTIGETYFFRERKTLEALAEHILPELIRRRRGHGQRLRLWSAACSTGEEPYSLAILLHELLPDWEEWRVTILGTDINGRSLKKAVAGVYGEWSFRDFPSELKTRYFTQVAERRFAIAPEIKDRVTFAQMNLAQDGFTSFTADTNAMDVILCRNVLIYFTPEHARRLVENLRHSLRDDGWLAVSPSECSQSLFSRFLAVNFPGAILYRKHHAEQQLPAAWTIPTALPLPALRTIEPPAPLLQAFEQVPATLEAALRTIPAPLSTPATLPTSVPPQTSADPLGFDADAASRLTRSLANEGRLADALASSERWLAADKLDATAHYLHAMISQELGDWESARRSLQRAVYLQPDFALAHFALGNCTRGDARSTDANKHFENALRLLRGRPPDEPVPESDGLTAGRLTEIISALLSDGESSR